MAPSKTVNSPTSKGCRRTLVKEIMVAAAAEPIPTGIPALSLCKRPACLCDVGTASIARIKKALATGADKLVRDHHRFSEVYRRPKCRYIGEY